MGAERHTIRLKRAYDAPAPEDGTRVLVERLWPRGLRKEQARIDVWLKDVAPSPQLRDWYGHDVAKWDEFRRRYEAELEGEAGQRALATLRDLARKGSLTLVFATRDTEHSSARLLYERLMRE